MRCSIRSCLFVVTVLSFVPRGVGAQDAESGATALSADGLLQEGQRLAAAGDVTGALARLREASKLADNIDSRLNIGAALADVGAGAEAIDVYRVCLKDPAIRRRQRRKAEAVLDELSAVVGGVRVTIEPPATITVAGRVIAVIGTPQVVYLDPGVNDLSIEKDGHVSQIKTVSAVAGQFGTLDVFLRPLPKTAGTVEAAATEKVINTTPKTPTNEVKKTPVSRSQVEPAQSANPGGRALMPWDVPVRQLGIGALAGLHVDVTSGGTVGFAALSYGLNPWVDLMLGVISGTENQGVYLGGRAFFLNNKLAPVGSLGATAVFVEGANFGVRAGGGLSYAIIPRLLVIGELAVEYYPKVPEGYRKALIVPSIVVEGRL